MGACLYTKLSVHILTYEQITRYGRDLSWHCNAGSSFRVQNRVGSKFGGGGVAGASETNVDRRERLRKLALETIDLAKVRPASFMRIRGC